MTLKGESAHPWALAHREWALVGTLFLAHAHLPRPQVIQLDNCHVANHHKGHYSHENDSLPQQQRKRGSDWIPGMYFHLPAHPCTDHPQVPSHQIHSLVPWLPMMSQTRRRSRNITTMVRIYSIFTINFASLRLLTPSSELLQGLRLPSPAVSCEHWVADEWDSCDNDGHPMASTNCRRREDRSPQYNNILVSPTTVQRSPKSSAMSPPLSNTIYTAPDP